ncbi:LacI family DNA-binding transcriptional regulator [Oceaniglobus roseus]|uniref:LacI family DNA-binding transcriptional regulator n=1 Tax=Oceaniglobus roseus TaxID=1737570 RepID=UPI000C7F4F79|nr:LacI family DNA-binding transcriptional regulator [Kandeliimicrobium roseum]
MAKRGGSGLEEIARAAGVSKMTVSRVLRGGSGFSEETRAKVMREVDRLGYVPNRLAAAFGPAGSSTLVGVCVPRFTSSLFGALLESLNATLARLGYQTMIGSHGQIPEEEETWLKGLASWRPAGVILAGRRHTAGTLDMLRSMGVPVVEIWDLTTSPLDISVGFSHFDNGLEMARCVLARGHRRIGYVGALGGRETMGRQRLEGFRAGLAEAGLNLIASEMLEDDSGFYPGFYGTETLLSREGNLDLIYYHDDEMAIGGLAFLRARGLDVPGRIGVAGWGGMEAASVLPQRLTTTKVPTARLGKAAAEALVGRLKGSPVQDVTVVPTQLVPGATIRPDA